MLRGLPGVRVFGPGLDSISIRSAGSTNSSGTPLILVNGSPMPIEFINTINPFDVEFIDILKNAGAAAYGHKAFDGVVAIYLKGVLGLSKLEKNKTPNPNILNSTFKGFYKTREFYSPNYAIADQDDNLQDFRTTLHWQPDIIMNEKEAPNLNFYTGDVSGSYLIHIEGITADGTPISVQKTFEVEEGTN